MNLRAAVIVLCLGIISLAGGCTAAGPSATTPPDAIDAVKEKLGYALAPDYVPQGFEYARPRGSLLSGEPGEPVSFVEVGEPIATLAYSALVQGDHLFVHYPVTFWPEGNPLLQRLGLRRPVDAVSEVEVSGETAYLVRGMWSKDTIEKKIPEGDISGAEWDYDICLSLFFDFEVSQDKRIGVVVRADVYPSEWITAEEMVRIAESIRYFD